PPPRPQPGISESLGISPDGRAANGPPIPEVSDSGSEVLGPVSTGLGAGPTFETIDALPFASVLTLTSPPPRAPARPARKASTSTPLRPSKISTAGPPPTFVPVMISAAPLPSTSPAVTRTPLRNDGS